MYAIQLLDHKQTKQILKGETITYSRLILNFPPQKNNTNHVHMTVGGTSISTWGS